MSTGANGLALKAGFVVVLILLGFVGLAGRFCHLMVLRHDEFLEMARSQQRVVVELKAVRGSITDRFGRELAMSRAAPSVAVDPSRVEIGERARVAADLAAVLEIPVEKVREQLERDCQFRWLRRQIHEPDIAARLGALDPYYTIIRFEPARCYPAGAAAAQVVGFTGIDGEGLSGLEMSLDATLSPSTGQRRVMRDAMAGAVRLPADSEGESIGCEDGEDVVLALDLTIQTFLEEALDDAFEEWRPETAVAVVLDPRTGDLLAAASRPTFDPRDLSVAVGEVLKNRVVTDMFVPGSIMKPLIAGAALDRGAVGFAESFDCTADGNWRHRGRVIHDHEPEGVLTFPEVLIRSSNIGAAQIGIRLGADEAYRHVRALGFGSVTDSGLPGEIAGMVTLRKDWDEVYTLPSVSFGQQISVTPLQFALAFASLANGGVLNAPRVFLRIGDREFPPRPLREVFRPEIARDFIAPTLERAVNEGTGRRARIEGYRVAGKTGTSQIKARTGEMLGYVSSFVGFAPVEEPRFLVLVSLKKPRRDRGTPYGGTVAAPAAREVLRRCLGYAEIPPSAVGQTALREVGNR